MSESGGPTTQSGILYQNSVAALYLGTLCDNRARPDSERIVRVRVEDLGSVDDIVLHFADEHIGYVQAKERLRNGTIEERKLWKDFDAQFQSAPFQRGRDRLLLHVGSSSPHWEEVAALTETAASSATDLEWWQRLSAAQRKIAEKVQPLLRASFSETLQLYEYFRHVEVIVWTKGDIRRTLVPNMMPVCNQSHQTLFRLLRDRVGEASRVRGIFTASELRGDLGSSDNVHFPDQPDMRDLRRAIEFCNATLRSHRSTFGRSGHHIGREKLIDEVLTWAQDKNGQDNTAVLLDGAGMGKSVLMRDVLVALEERGITVLAVKCDIHLANVVRPDDLKRALGLPDSIERSVGRLAVENQMVVLIDQLDALSLSMAHDQKGLNVTLGLVAQLQKIPGVRVLLSCRLFDYRNDPRLRQATLGKEIYLGQLSDEEVTNVLSHLNVEIDTLSPATRELLRTPLHLDLFALLLAGQTDTGRLSGVVSLQDLYSQVWNDIVVSRNPGTPPVNDRLEVVRFLTQYMEREQRTTAPVAAIVSPDGERLLIAAHWLTSSGVLVQDSGQFSFLHQTFFDYSYARHFVERGEPLTQAVLNGDQGLFTRPQLIQVLTYLRSTEPRKFLQEFRSLLNAPQLRYHLRDLMVRWFGSLHNPTSDEALFARFLLVTTGFRGELLAAMQGNAQWFQMIQLSVVPGLLAASEKIVDEDVVPYLSSLAEVEQQAIAEILLPYVDRGDKWIKRIQRVMLRIREWRSEAMATLVEKWFGALTTVTERDHFALESFAKAFPTTGLRLVRTVLDQVLNGYLSAERIKPRFHEFCSTLEQLNGRRVVRAIRHLADNVPAEFLAEMLPWLERTLCDSESRDESLYFKQDELSGYLHYPVYPVRHQIIDAFASALNRLGVEQADLFRETVSALSGHPWVTPQEMVARAYAALPETYADDALAFLVSDQRRLILGDNEQYETRHLIKAIEPHLSDSQVRELETAILGYTNLRKWMRIHGLQERGRDQLNLLRSITDARLSETGKRTKRELERKFPRYTASLAPLVGQAGIVGSPIPTEKAPSMNDRSWLRAMKKYHGAVEHREFFKGGAAQLSTVLAEAVRLEPCRFRRLLDQVPDDVDSAYAIAFMNGFAESEGPSDYLFDTVRRFGRQPNRDIRQSVAWALEKRANSPLPEDLSELLQEWTLSGSQEEEHGNLDTDSLNVAQAAAFRAQMRALQVAGRIGNGHRWSALETAVASPSDAVRVAAAEYLAYSLSDDRTRAIDLFEELVRLRPHLLGSQYVQQFIYHALHNNIPRLLPYVRFMMSIDDPDSQQRGAELACLSSLAALSANLSKEERETADGLAEQALSGATAWRRGAARIYAYNVSGNFSSVCVSRLNRLLTDEDEQVCRSAVSALRNLSDQDVTNPDIRMYVEHLAVSRAIGSGQGELPEFLWEHGIIDPEWALRVVAEATQKPEENDVKEWLPGDEHFVRLVLHIYMGAERGTSLRTLSMDVFDTIMAGYHTSARSVLNEWDRR